MEGPVFGKTNEHYITPANVGIRKDEQTQNIYAYNYYNIFKLFEMLCKCN